MEIGFYNISQGNCYNDDEMATQENKFCRFSLNTFNLYKALQISKICLLKQLKHEKYKPESQIIMKLKVKLLSCIRLFQTP